MTIDFCDLCGAPALERRFSRRGSPHNQFCSISCVEAFETRAGLPPARIYEDRPGWSPFPAVARQGSALPC